MTLEVFVASDYSNSPMKLIHALLARGYNVTYPQDLSTYHEFEKLENSDICILSMSSGGPAHLLFGYTICAGKLTIVFNERKRAQLKLYGMADHVCTSVEAVLAAIDEAVLETEKLIRRPA